MRGASQITDSEFLTAYNDAKLTNDDVMQKLDTDWTAIGVKLRSDRLKKHLTVEMRVGGRSGGCPRELAASELTPEAAAWRSDGTVVPKPSTTPKVDSSSGLVNAAPSMLDATREMSGAGSKPDETAVASGAIGETAVASGAIGGGATDKTAAPATAAPATAAPATAVPNATPAGKPGVVGFDATIYNQYYQFSGATIGEATDKFMLKLRELNLSKMLISDRSGRLVGLADFVNGGKYKVTPQLTAAGA
jgi:hypothetical protein